MQIGQIIKQSQPDVYNKLMGSRPMKYPKHKTNPKHMEKLSLRETDRMMREDCTVDPERCKGR